MAESRLPELFDKKCEPPIRSGFGLVPSWALSLLAHGGLIVVLAATLAGKGGGIVGDADGDFRKIGIYVGHSGSGGEGTGNTPSIGTEASDDAGNLARQQPVTAPLAIPPKASAVSTTLTAATPSVDKVATYQARTVIGPGASPDKENQPRAQPADTGPAPISPATSAAKRGGRASAARGGRGGGPRGSFGTAPFFGIWDVGWKFVYVIDCSGSMFSYNAIQAAKNELLTSLASLKRSQQFQIVFYNLDQKWMTTPGKTDFQYFPASESNRRLAAQFVAEVQPTGGTQHLPALELALRIHPDVIFFLTDAGEPAMKPAEMEQIRRLNGGHSRIHCVQFGLNDHEAADFLRKLASDNNGDYAYQNVKRFAEAGLISGHSPIKAH